VCYIEEIHVVHGASLYSGADKALHVIAGRAA
jgi:hypothetical protein